MTIAITKGVIGEQDLYRIDGTATDTFSRETSSGLSLTLNKVGYEVDALSTYGAGVNFTAATINAAITAISTRQKTLLLKPGTWVMEANITVPANVTLKIPRGVTITTTGFTLTINGTIDAGLYQVFSGTGTVTIATQNTKHPEWWGALPDGTTDCSTALTACLVGGGKIELQFGTYKLTSKIAHTNTAISIKGAGIRQTYLSWIGAADGGLDIDFDAVDDHVNISGISFLTDAAAGGDAINIYFPDVGSSAKSNVQISQVEIYPNTNTSDYWTNGIVLSGTWNSTISDSYITGKINTVSMTSGITLNDENIACVIDHVDIQNADSGIVVADDAQGTTIEQCNMVYVNNGVYAWTNAMPHLTVHNCHMNAWVRGITVQKTYDCLFSNNLIYKWQESTQASWTGIETHDDSSRNSIHHNTIVVNPLSTGLNYGISVLDNQCTIDNNILYMLAASSDVGIALTAAATLNKVTNNYRIGGATTVSNAGINNFMSGNYPHDGYHTFSNGDTTPAINVSSGNLFKTANLGATTVTMLDGQSLYTGYTVYILIGDAYTTFDFSGTNLMGNAGVNKAFAAGDMVVATWDGLNWMCTLILAS